MLRDPQLALERRAMRRRRALRRSVAATLAVLAAVGLGSYLFHVRRAPVQSGEASTPSTLEPSTPQAVAPTPRVETPEIAPALPALPPLAESDGLVRDLARGLSARPELAEWLATPELVRKVVAVVENVAGGESPRPHLLFLEPGTPFDVVRRQGRLYVDPQSYARYDRIADVLVSLDPQGSVELGRRLKPLIDEAYRELGHPDERFEDALARAMRVLLATPVVEGDIEVTSLVVTYAMAAPELQTLSPAQKHLLRMGPRNVRLVQGQLRAMARALGMPEGEMRETVFP